MPPPSSATQAIIAQIEKVALLTEGVSHTVAVAGQSILLEHNAPNFGEMYVMLDDFPERAGIANLQGDAIARRLQEAVRHISDATVNVFGTTPSRGWARPGASRSSSRTGATSGQEPPVRAAWQFTNQSNAFCNLMVTASVCMCGSDGTFDSMGEAMICNFDGTIIAHGAQGRVDEIITAEARPDLVREARAVWGVENNIYQFGHRDFSAVRGGAGDCPYTYMHDLAAGRYRLPWEDSVQVTDGTGCGIAAPTRVYSEPTAKSDTMAQCVHCAADGRSTGG